MQPERKHFSLKSSLQRADTSVKVPEQPRLLCRELGKITIGGCRHAGVRGFEKGDIIFFLQDILGVKHDKPSQLAALPEKLILPMGWQHEEVDRCHKQHKQFDPGG